MNGPNWMERIRGLVPQRGGTLDKQTREVRNRSSRGVVLTLLLVGFLVVAVAASSLFSGRAMMSMPTVSGLTSPEGEVMPFTGGGYQTGDGTVKEPANTTGTEQQGQNWDRMIIRTATLQLTVKDVSASMDSVRSVVGGHAG